MTDKSRRLLTSLLAAAVLASLSCKKNLPPDVPTVLSGPTFCFKDTTCVFTTIAADPDGDSVAVQFDWGDSSHITWSGWRASGDTVTMSHVWSAAGSFDVRAWAVDRKQVASGLSGVHTVQVALRRPPNTPAKPSGPDVGGKDSSYAFAIVAFHPDSISVAIRLSWGDGDTSDWSPFVASGESVKLNHSWSTPATYGITAQARDTGNALSPWSDEYDIRVRPLDTLRKWRYQLAAAGDLCPAIGSDGTIYVGSSDSSLLAVSGDGTLKWRYQTGGYIRSSPSLAADGSIYFWSDDKRLYSLNPDGTLKWSYFIGGSAASSPAIAADGTVYVGSSDRYLRAFNPDSSLKWFYLTDRHIECSPAVGADGTVYVGSVGFYALNPDGTLRWRYETGGNIPSSPAIAADGTLYFGSTDNHLYALNPDGSLKWQYDTGGDVASSPVIAADGNIYVGSTDDYFYALNTDGTLRWRYKTHGSIHSSPAASADGTVYYGSDDNFLYALYPDGTLKWRYETGSNVEASPTIGSDGTVYFVSYDGYLYALKGTSPLADSPWPKFHHDLRNTGRVGGGRR